MIVGLVILAAAAIALAHSVVLWAYVENNHVYVEAFFSDGARVINGRIVVLDAEGKKLLEGTTDEQGNFDFDPPIRDDMTILLLIDAGHRAEFKIKKSDFETADPESTPSTDASPVPQPSPTPTPTPEPDNE